MVLQRVGWGSVQVVRGDLLESQLRYQRGVQASLARH